MEDERRDEERGRDEPSPESEDAILEDGGDDEAAEGDTREILLEALDQQVADKARESILSRDRRSRQRDEGLDEDRLFDSSQFTPPARAVPGEDRPKGERTKIQIINDALSMDIMHISGITMQDMAVFCRQLSTLLDVGIPLLRALRILAQRSTHPRLRRIAAQVAQDVEEGNTLSSALKKHPKTFSRLFVSVIEVGELGGILEASTRRLAELLEMKVSMKRKVRSAMMYPTAAVIVCIAVVTFIMYWGVPRFETIYEGLGASKGKTVTVDGKATKKPGAELPKITRQLIAVSRVIKNYPHFYLPVLVGVIIALILFGRTGRGRYIYDWLALRVRLIGPICTKVNVARFTRSIGSLVAAGIPLLEALKVTARTSENAVMARKLSQVHETLEGGGRLEEPLRRDKTVPPMVVDMMVIGYESGAIEDMLLRIADNYDSDVDETLKGLASIIEPVLIVFLGMAVLFVALALLLPYFNLVHAI